MELEGRCGYKSMENMVIGFGKEEIGMECGWRFPVKIAPVTIF
jgi:hypothetical protein